eukprot:gene16186-17813_t
MHVTRHRKILQDTERNPDYLSRHCSEILMMIIAHCKAKDLLNLSCTCKRLKDICYGSEQTWMKLCNEDFDTQLLITNPFGSYFEIYRMLYQSRLVMGAHVYCSYFEKKHFATIPNWIWCLAMLSNKPPVMKYGRQRFIRRCSGHYLQRFAQLPLGQVKRAFGLKTEELLRLFPGRVERGTVYYTYQAVRYSLFRKHNGRLGFNRFILNKCYRARHKIANLFEKIKGQNPIRSSMQSTT